MTIKADNITNLQVELIRKMRLPFAYSVGMGHIERAEVMSQNGHKENVGISGFQDIWSGSANKVYQDNPATLVIFSDNAADIGMIFQIEGCGPGFVPQKGVVVTNGTTEVTAPGTWLRVNYLRNVGPTPTAGDVTLSKAGGVEPQAYALALHQQSVQSHYTIPAGYYGFSNSYVVGPGSNTFDLLGKLRYFGGTWLTMNVEKIFGSTSRQTDWMLAFPPKTDAKFMAKGFQGATDCGIAYTVALLPEELILPDSIGYTVVT